MEDISIDSTISTNHDRSESQNGDTEHNPDPNSISPPPEDAAIQSTDGQSPGNDAGEPSKLDQFIQSSDTDVNTTNVDPEPPKEPAITALDKEEVKPSVTMIELLGELKNLDVNIEDSPTAVVCYSLS